MNLRRIEPVAARHLCGINRRSVAQPIYFRFREPSLMCGGDDEARLGLKIADEFCPARSAFCREDNPGGDKEGENGQHEQSANGTPTSLLAVLRTEARFQFWPH